MIERPYAQFSVLPIVITETATVIVILCIHSGQRLILKISNKYHFTESKS